MFIGKSQTWNRTLCGRKGRVQSMNRQEMNQMALDIVREEKRGSGIVSTAGVMDQVASVLTAVEVDRKYMKSCVGKALSSVSGNPLNAILGLVGLKVIRKDADIKIFEGESAGNELDSMLRIDEKAFRPMVARMASDLAAYEKEVDEDRADKVNRINDMVTKLDAQDQAIRQLKAEAKSQLQTVADRIQYMLCVLGPDKSDNALAEQLSELMEDLEIRAVWDTDGASAHAEDMFIELRTADVEKHKMKPCLIRRGEVIAKGLKVCMAETEGAL